MHRHRWWIAVVVLIAAVGAVCYWFTRPLLVSQKNAEQAIRVFEGKPGLQFTFLGLEKDHMRPIRYYYRFWTPMDLPRRSDWEVNAVSGIVERASYSGQGSFNGSDKPLGPRTEKQCRKIAADFLRSRYGEPLPTNLQLVNGSGSWRRRYWTFSWGLPSVTKDSTGPKMARVSVSPVTGLVVNYRRYPAPDRRAVSYD